MPDRLKDKVAVITGGCSGMGLATVELFVKEGASVIIADIQDEKGASLASRLGPSARFIHCDVTAEADIESAVALAVDTYGRLDIMFNNAASSGTPLMIEEMTVEAWDESHALILRSVMLGSKHAARVMGRQGGGAIINTSSGTSVLPFRPGRGPVYPTMKAAVSHFSKVLAAELGPKNIRVNAILPGYVTTSILGITAGASQEVSDAMVPFMDEAFAVQQPIARAGKPEDVAEAVLYLASDAALWITGVNLPIDGGFLVKYAAHPSITDAMSEARRRAEQVVGGS